MKYTRENYEEFALDYLEGNMSPVEREDFEVFLLVNPDIKGELEEFRWVTLTPDPEVEFPDTAKLMREPEKGVISLKIRRWVGVAAAILLLVASSVYILDSLWNDRAGADFVRQSSEEDPINPEFKKQNKALDDSVTEPRVAIDEESSDSQNAQYGDSGNASVPGDRSMETLPQPIPDQVETWESQTLVESQTRDIQKTDELVDENLTIRQSPEEVRQIVSVSLLPLVSFDVLVYDRPIDEEYLPEIFFDEEEDVKNGIVKFLARANLIPSVLTDIDKEDLKEKFIPESFQTR